MLYEMSFILFSPPYTNGPDVSLLGLECTWHGQGWVNTHWGRKACPCFLLAVCTERVWIQMGSVGFILPCSPLTAGNLHLIERFNCTAIANHSYL